MKTQTVALPTRAEIEARLLNDVLTPIARDVLGIETLETRKADSLDFHEVAVWEVRKALVAAYQRGYSAGAR